MSSDDTSRDRQNLAHAAADEMRSPDALLYTIPIPEITASAVERFLAKIAFTGESDSPLSCWEWTASCNASGYGRFNIGGRILKAHRVSWAWRNGPIPAGLTLDHICHGWDSDCLGGTECRHRRCVNPDHLIPKTMRANTLAGNTIIADMASRERCPNHHELIDSNLVGADLLRAKRVCRICGTVRSRARARARRAGGDLDAQRAAARAAIAELTGEETPRSLGIPPASIHYTLGLVESQPSLDLEIVRSP